MVHWNRANQRLEPAAIRPSGIFKDTERVPGSYFKNREDKYRKLKQCSVVLLIEALRTENRLKRADFLS